MVKLQSAEAEWEYRLGTLGSSLRSRYLVLRFGFAGFVGLIALVDLPRWPWPAWFVTPGAVIVQAVVEVAVVLAIVVSQVLTKRRLVAEVLDHARLPPMPISDHSLWSLSGYDNWLGRVGSSSR